MNKAQEKPTVIKLGGAALAQPSTLLSLLEQVQAALGQRPWVLVHGGGALVDEWLCNMGCSTEKRHGQRVTPAEQMPVVTGALAGYSNKALVSVAQTAGIDALGLSLLDAACVPLLPVHELGQVGTPDWQKIADQQAMYAQRLQVLLAGKLTPVVSSIGGLADGQLVNVNADLAAAAIAFVLEAELVLLSDVAAVLDAEGQPIGDITYSQGHALLAQDFVQGGMYIKLQAALEAASRCRRTTAITSWENPQQVVALLQGQSIGTRILS
ncbi:acetylglutamate kinase [Aliidiomarina taiwanensis]|uniref:Acetylglutamate kinase n=1 Tax=Aliidiomarina taiwanensis TaxID=946228 RepID=A0A432X9A7_9GAMM|nr:acetylglutamate kinase [Aliidiomarina taiwanensis]RUO43992.1 acetylglutamate kinase [Aliidiomarina taiwanensis]